MVHYTFSLNHNLSTFAWCPPSIHNQLECWRCLHQKASQSSQSQVVKNNITLRGSTKIVTEFFGYAINSILYQRAIYPEDMFEAKKEYNLQIMVTKDKKLQQYLNNILIQMQQWLLSGDIQKLVLVIASIDDGTPLERWVFNVETDRTKTMGSKSSNKSNNK